MSLCDVSTRPFSRRDALRTATAHQHAALDGMVAAQDNFSGLSGYLRWLQGMFRFHRDVEHAFAHGRFDAHFPIGPLRQRTLLLRQDMADLGHVASDHDLPRLVCATRAEALGILYVTEGASLGARLLFIRAKKLGLSEVYGARHLGYAAHDLQPWRTLLAMLENFDAAPEDDRGMVAAAQRTFDLATIHLGQPA